MVGNRRMLPGLPLFVAGGAALLVTQAWMFVLSRNAFYWCAAMPNPVGVVPHEGGPAGFGIVQLPVAGFECRWNELDGGILTTFHPDVPLTVLTYVAVAAMAVGLVGLVQRTVGSRRATTEARAEGGA